MREYALVLLLCLGLVAPIQADVRLVDPSELTQTDGQRRAAKLITQFLSRHHYKKLPLDDRFSSQLFDRYLESLDPNRSYLTRADVSEFERDRYQLDDMLRRASAKLAFAMFKRFRQRVDERTAAAIAMLDLPFDFTKDEEHVFDRTKAAWPNDQRELDEIWRLRVKNDVLSQRLAGKEPAAIRDLLVKRYERVARRVQQLNSDDVFQLFMSAYGRTIEPHTSYLSPRSSENFRIRMSLSLEGIGAALQTDNEYTVVRRIIPGGPADLNKKLKIDDRIVGVAQGDEEMVDVVSWRLEDVVDLIRGKKGTTVRLDVLPKGAGATGKHHVIALVRDKVKLEEQAAKRSILENVPGAPGRRIGVIDLPTFYLDIEARARGDADFRSTTRDVRRLLGELKAERVDGVIIDLRGNSGGSLIEATDLTGLFIDTGPVVQMRYSNGRIQVNKDDEDGVAYDGPLGVLVDRFSASASEIFAGAIQDYGRGIILGEPTFGKGTVQHLVPLDRYAESGVSGLGQLKMTVAQFFRINGESTQHRGVKPDIIFPTALGSESQGERALDNALEWSRTTPAAYTPVVALPGLLDGLRVRHEDRVNADPQFQILVEDAKFLAEESERKSVSLVEASRRSERDGREARNLERENRLRALRGLPPRDPNAERTGDASDEPDDLGDATLEEAARILVDYLATPGVGGLRLESAGSG